MWCFLSALLTATLLDSATLPRCSDPAPLAIDCATLTHDDEVRRDLCPRLVQIMSAPCATLASIEAVENIIGGENMTVLVASANVTREVDFKSYYKQAVFTGLYMPGIVHVPRDLATLLVHLANERSIERHAVLRLVVSNSNNGWALCIVAAYLRRVHGGPLVGLGVNGLKTEWATNRNVRILLEAFNLSWRSPTVFDAAADAALMTYHPHVRNSLTPTTFAKATTLLPVSWTGTPPPFDICMRMGEYSREAMLDDIRLVGGACRTFAFTASAASQDAAALEGAFSAAAKTWCESCFSAHPQRHDGGLRQVGSFVVRESSHLRASGESFEFVNKTPPSAASLYAPACIQDMAGCDWHRGVPDK